MVLAFLISEISDEKSRESVKRRIDSSETVGAY